MQDDATSYNCNNYLLQYNYKIAEVLHLIIDLSCPIELRSYELLTDDAGTTRAYLQLYNLSDKTITGYSATVRWSRDMTDDEVNDNIAVDAIAIDGKMNFELKLTGDLVRNADRMELYFTVVEFSDGTRWKSHDGDLIDVDEQPYLQGPAAQKMRDTAGEDAIMYPQVQDKFWRCVCGRINLLDEESCRRCGRDRNYVLRELNPKALGFTEEEKKQNIKRRKKAMRSVKKVEKAKSDTVFLVACVSAAVLMFLLLQVLAAVM